MAIEVFNRYEKKFLIDEKTFNTLSMRLSDYVELDEYNKKNGFYSILNIYYDTEDDYYIRTSIQKPTYKEKLRLRSYGVPDLDSQVYIEIKKKVHKLVNKRRTPMILSDAYHFLQTKEVPKSNIKLNKQVINEILYFLNNRPVMPKLFLAYDRTAYFSNESRDLRITFDTNIRTRRHDLRLENGDFGDILLRDGLFLLEVKAKDSIPLWLVRLLSENKVYATSFSKYGTEYKKYLTERLKERKLYA